MNSKQLKKSSIENTTRIISGIPSSGTEETSTKSLTTDSLSEESDGTSEDDTSIGSSKNDRSICEEIKKITGVPIHSDCDVNLMKFPQNKKNVKVGDMILIHKGSGEHTFWKVTPSHLERINRQNLVNRNNSVIDILNNNNKFVSKEVNSTLDNSKNSETNHLKENPTSALQTVNLTPKKDTNVLCETVTTPKNKIFVQGTLNTELIVKDGNMQICNSKPFDGKSDFDGSLSHPEMDLVLTSGEMKNDISSKRKRRHNSDEDFEIVTEIGLTVKKPKLTSPGRGGKSFQTEFEKAICTPSMEPKRKKIKKNSHEKSRYEDSINVKNELSKISKHVTKKTSSLIKDDNFENTCTTTCNNLDDKKLDDNHCESKIVKKILRQRELDNQKKNEESIPNVVPPVPFEEILLGEKRSENEYTTVADENISVKSCSSGSNSLISKSVSSVSRASSEEKTSPVRKIASIFGRSFKKKTTSNSSGKDPNDKLEWRSPLDSLPSQTKMKFGALPDVGIYEKKNGTSDNTASGKQSDSQPQSSKAFLLNMLKDVPPISGLVVPQTNGLFANSFDKQTASSNTLDILEKTATVLNADAVSTISNKDLNLKITFSTKADSVREFDLSTQKDTIESSAQPTLITEDEYTELETGEGHAKSQPTDTNSQPSNEKENANEDALNDKLDDEDECTGDACAATQENNAFKPADTFNADDTDVALHKDNSSLSSSMSCGMKIIEDVLSPPPGEDVEIEVISQGWEAHSEVAMDTSGIRSEDCASSIRSVDEDIDSNIDDQHLVTNEEERLSGNSLPNTSNAELTYEQEKTGYDHSSTSDTPADQSDTPDKTSIKSSNGSHEDMCTDGSVLEEGEISSQNKSLDVHSETESWKRNSQIDVEDEDEDSDDEGKKDLDDDSESSDDSDHETDDGKSVDQESVADSSRGKDTSSEAGKSSGESVFKTPTKREYNSVVEFIYI